MGIVVAQAFCIGGSVEILHRPHPYSSHTVLCRAKKRKMVDRGINAQTASSLYLAHSSWAHYWLTICLSSFLLVHISSDHTSIISQLLKFPSYPQLPRHACTTDPLSDMSKPYHSPESVSCS